METREGYKKTEIGWIPEDWECVSTESLLKKRKGAIKIGPFGSQLKKSFFVKDGFKVYGQENAYANNYQIGSRYIDSERFDTLKTCKIEPGDFLISMMGTIGKCSIVPENIEVGIMDSHLLRLQIDNKKYSKRLLSHLFLSELILKRIKTLSVGGIMDGLSSAIIKSLYFPCPPLPEQQKIASILTTVDDKISSIDQQIQQTEQLKKGLMEKLLTEGIGHTEFKETEIGRIPASWDVVKVGENVNLMGGFAFKSKDARDKGTKW